MSFRRAVVLLVATALLTATSACSSPTAPVRKSCDQNGTTWTLC